MGWPWPGGGGHTPTEGCRGLHRALSRVKVHGERGNGCNPGSLPRGSEFLARFRSLAQWNPPGTSGCDYPAPPLPPVACRPEGSLASAGSWQYYVLCMASASSEASAKVLDAGRVPSTPGLRVANLGSSLGGLPGHMLQPRSQGGCEGRGMPVVAHRRAAMVTPSPAAQDLGSPLRLPPVGPWHVATPQGRFFIPPISERRKLRSGMAQSACPKSCSWWGPGPDRQSEAHGPCRPGLGRAQA